MKYTNPQLTVTGEVPTGFSHTCLINVQMNPNGMIIINALPVKMLQGSLNTDG